MTDATAGSAEFEWSRMTAAEINAAAAAGAIVLAPVASTEQHGPHLPTGCDTILACEVCRRAARLLSTRRAVIVAPTLWVGLAHHHVALGGTFTISMATYEAVLRDLVQSMKDAGFTKILLVNGHGGNVAALKVLTEALTRELRLKLATTNYAALPTEAGDYAAILEDQPAMHHAGEAETSMLMAIDPAYVRADKLPSAYQDGYRKGDPSPADATIRTWVPFKDFTPIGVRGDARRASAEKGERLLAASAQRLADALVDGGPWG